MKIKKYIKISGPLFSAALALGTLGCSHPKTTKPETTAPVQAAGPGSGPEVKPIPAMAQVSHKAESLNEAIEEFGFTVLTGLRKTEKGNTVISPVSLHMALSMLENGAKEQTKTDLDRGLWLEGLGDAYNSQYGTWQKEWNQKDAKTTLLSANALWYVQGNIPLPNYLQSVSPYEATLSQLTGSNDHKAGQINTWVDGKTNHTIKTLVTPAQMSNTTFALTNAVYFKGLWMYPFTKIASTMPFATANGSSVPKTFMKRKADYVYQKGGFGVEAKISYEAIRLPYGEQGNSKFSMLLIVPIVDDIDTFVERLHSSNGISPYNKNNFSTLVDSMYAERANQETVEITMPLLTLDYTAGNLDAVLQKDVGLQRIYGGEADFSNLFGSKGSSVSTVIHKTFLRVDPEKTEASAATAVLMTKGLPPPFQRMLVNRSFFFAIMDDQKKLPLFMGVIADPPQP